MIADTEDLSAHIGHYVANARFEHLPTEAVEATKKSILDTFGVCLAARALEPAVQPYLDFARGAGNLQESSIIGEGQKVPAPMAAFANGALAHALDFDDRTEWGQHCSSSLVPAVLAAAQREGNIDGKRLITAMAIGQDLFNRFRQHIEWRKDWNFSSVMGIYSATAAVCSLMDFDATQVVDALSIASQQSCGTSEIVNAPGGKMRGTYAAFPAMGAVNSAILAQIGAPGIASIFEGRRGVLELYFAGRFDKAALIAGLGSDFRGSKTLYKIWPAVGVSHSHIHATLRVVEQHNIKPEEIAEIRIRVGDYHRLLCEPLDARRRPRNDMDARFSLPFLVATAAVRRSIRLSDFSSAALADPEVLSTADRVIPFSDDNLNWDLVSPPGEVEIALRDGRTFSQVGNMVPGNAESPLSWDQIVEKFLDCTSNATHLISDRRRHQVTDAVRSLEDQSSGVDFLSA